jgi:hypothetical protein
MGVIKKNRYTFLFLPFLLLVSACVEPVVYQPLAENSPSATIAPSLVAPDTTVTASPIFETTQAPTPTTQNAEFHFSLTSTPSIQGLYGFPDNINPLTGLPVEDPSILNRRPVMIKVSNYPRGGRPHAGLSFADIVFEYYIGEQMNRFLAIYYGQDAYKIGPIRSGRLVDPQLASMYGGVLVYGGADMRVETVILNIIGDERAITNNNAPCPPICGSETHSIAGVFADSAETSLYVTKEGIDNSRPNLTGMIFDPQVPTSGSMAVDIGVEYSFRDRGEWRYDPETGKYMRWIEMDDNYTMIPLVDRLTNQQLAFSNVVILFATYIEYNATLHDILIWNNSQGQRAVTFRDAMMIEGTWKVPDHNHVIQLYNSYGLPVALKPGNTWFVIAGNSSTLEESENGHWEMQFDLP